MSFSESASIALSEASSATLSGAAGMSEERIRALLIANNPAQARLIWDLVNRDHSLFRLEHASRLSAGLDRLARGGIDLVLLDLSLADSQGLETFRWVQAAVPQSPIVVLVDPSEHSLTRQVMKEGATDYLTKGDLAAGLLARVMRHALELHRACPAAGNLTEEQQSQSEPGYSALIENAPYGIYRSTLDSRFLFVNSVLVNMLGYGSKAELLAMNLATDIYEDPEARARLIEQYQQDSRFEGAEVEWKRKDGTPIHVRLSGRAVRDHQGSLACWEVVVEDVTERRALEERLRQSQKMEGIGRLAGGIAHDFNNLLNVIVGYSELILTGRGVEDKVRRKAEEIKKAGERATALTRQLLAFSRKQVLEPKVLDLNAVVAEMEQMLRRLIGEHIELGIRPAGALGLVKADPGQLSQVLMNLALNARDAMPQGGVLTIETANVELGEGFRWQRVAVLPGPYVMLSVSDTGAGMDAGTRDHIFEPFFTTKEQGKGTGLGLATVYGVVKQSGGYIWVYSEPGKGSTFKIYLPRCGGAAEPLGVPQPSTSLPKATETVLLVEDEESLRKLTRQFLEERGYTVLEARDGQEALQISQSYKESIHLTLTDVVMPRMGGRELSEKLMALRPQMKVLYMSGYTDDTMLRQGQLRPGAAYLQKPFNPSDLARKAREVLDATKENLPATAEAR